MVVVLRAPFSFCGVVDGGSLRMLPAEPLLGVRCVEERSTVSVGSIVHVVSRKPEAEFLRR